MIRILLAEDDEAMRVYLARALERSGYAVESVDRGTAALAKVVAGESFDLLLTDIVMPEMDGIELAQKVSILVPEMRVMFITGFSAAARWAAWSWAMVESGSGSMGGASTMGCTVAAATGPQLSLIPQTYQRQQTAHQTPKRIRIRVFDCIFRF